MTRTAALVGLLVAAGCAGPSGGAMAWQRDYANKHPPGPARTNALGSVAMSAAYLGDGKTVRSVLDDLRGDPAHDEFAGKCAVELDRAGHPAEAKRVARRIEDKARRQAALDKLAPKPDDAPAATKSE